MAQATGPLRELIGKAISYSRSGDRDEFSEPPRAGKYLGADIRFNVPLHSFRSPRGANYLSSASYDYADGQLTAYLNHWWGTADLFEPATVIQGRSYSGANAFGVSALIRVETILKGGVSVTNVMDPSRGNARSAASNQGRSFVYVEEISGENARRLASNLKCRSGRGNPPTRAKPLDFKYHFCTIAIEASRIALVDRSTGRSLKVWEGSDLVTGGR